MARIQPNDQDTMLIAVTRAIEMEIRSIAKEETEKALAESEKVILQRVQGMVDRIAMKIASQYEVQNMAGRIIIEVRKLQEPS